MSEEHRRRVILQKVSDLETPRRRLVPGSIRTGFPQLDSALGGSGVPRGRITEIFGASSSGKTTLALQIAAQAQRDGWTSAWIDAERAFEPAYAAACEVALETLLLARPDSAEQALGIARELVLSAAVDLVIVDSAAALVPTVELETSIGESGHGLQSRVLGSELRKLAAVVEKCGAAMLFLNQVRSRPDDSECTAGGPSLKLYAAIRIALEPAAGGDIVFRVLKNSLGQPFSKGILRRATPYGFVRSP